MPSETVSSVISKRRKGRDASASDQASGGPPRPSRLVRDVALILIGACLLYLLVCLGTHSMDDPGWFSRGSNGVTAPLHNTGGPVGAWIADLLVGRRLRHR